tara:strand:- start:32744 stop:32956 length:213 start_codon:yes stop_codon:yes gene_type:complete
MTTDEFLNKHGETKCEFYNAYKHSFTYLDVDGKFKIYGLAEYRGDFDKVMTVRDLWNEMDTFSFEFVNGA